MQSIESQIIEGVCGDLILVGGRNRPSLTAEVKEGAKNQLYWPPGGKKVTLDRGRFNWYGRGPEWKDEIGFRGKEELEKRVGEWNRSEVICDRDTIKNIVNGKVVNYGTNSSHRFGKIQLQSEGAEIISPRVEMRPSGNSTDRPGSPDLAPRSGAVSYTKRSFQLTCVRAPWYTIASICACR
jgi:hypothetical protein